MRPRPPLSHCGGPRCWTTTEDFCYCFACDGCIAEHEREWAEPCPTCSKPMGDHDADTGACPT